MKSALLGTSLALLLIVGGCRNPGNRSCSRCGPPQGFAGASGGPAGAGIVPGACGPYAGGHYAGGPAFGNGAGAPGTHAPLMSATPDYISQMPLHADRAMTGGPPAGAYAYPYYTTRGPRDFLLDNPPTIGR